MGPTPSCHPKLPGPPTGQGRWRLKSLWFPLLLVALGNGAAGDDRAHPRLYLAPDTLPTLRQSIQGSHAALWKIVRDWTDARLDDPPLDSLERDIRRAGELIPYAALCYLLTDDGAYLELARRYMTAIAGQPHWADDIDIEAAHLLYGLAVGYDWLHADLTPAEQALIRAKLLLQGQRLRPRAGQRHPPLNNHRVVNLCALGIAGLALEGEEAVAAEWIAHCDRVLPETLEQYGPDGYSCEGLSYWSYASEYILKYLTATDRHRHLLSSQRWLKSAALAPIYHALPRESWRQHNLFLNIGDAPRFCWYGPQHQLFRLAALHGLPQAQWLANELVQAGITRAHADWLGLLWFDPDVAARPDGLPLTHRYANWDLAIMRSGWHANETICAFKCSPVGGAELSQASPRPYPGSGHMHPDANSFLLFGHGEWLAADDGATLVKRTSTHNTVIVNGVGQAGEGKRWFTGAKQFGRTRPARFVHFQDNEQVTYIVGDASGIYGPGAGLVRFHRHFLYVRPNLVVIVDELASRRNARFDWLLHTPGDIDIKADAPIVISRRAARLQVQVIEPAAPRITARAKSIDTEYPRWDWRQLNVLTVTPPARRDTTRFVVAMLIGDPAKAPLEVQRYTDSNGSGIDVSAGDKLHQRIRLAAPGLTLTEAIQGSIAPADNPARVGR